MSHYQHLNIEERESIWELRMRGTPLCEIARVLNRSASTISRELKRNQAKGYRPSRAQASYEKRRKNSCRRYVLAHPILRAKVIRLLATQQWSPEQISNRLAYEEGLKVSYNTIYRALKTGLLEEPGVRKSRHGRYPLQKHLRHKGRRYKGGGPQSKSYVTAGIEARPKAAQTRSQYGHWEGDTVYHNHSKTFIVTLVDRKSRYLITGCCGSRKPGEMSQVLTQLLQSLPGNRIKSITLDRGSEFANHAQVTEQLPQAKFYFAHPMSPWERGTNENTNGLLRQYIPKHSHKTPFSEQLLKQFTRQLNFRPRKCLGWRSPFEVFFHQSLHLT